MTGGERALQADAQALAAALAHTAHLWRPAPFHDDPPWVAQRPALAAALLALDDRQVDGLERDPGALTRFIAAHVPESADALAVVTARERPAPPAPRAVPETLGRDVPGRKWQQVRHFAGAAAPLRGALVEWCCGKGHLGRLLARDDGVTVTGVEWNAALCEDGARLAARDGLAMRFVCADVLRDARAASTLDRETHAIALHACGDLHLRLLRDGVARGVRAFSVAPCCYHLTADDDWRPLSPALAGRLALGREDLRLAVQETVTSGARVRRQTTTLAAWRLGFDRLQREVRGVDAYLPCPSSPARVLGEGFPAFCARLAAHHGIVLPRDTDYVHFERLGSARHRHVTRLELVRHAFRRPLEWLLVLDRALFLAGHGYDVEVLSFCPRSLTPRNLLLRAVRATGRPAGAAPAAPG